MIITKTMIIPDEHYQKLILAYLQKLDVLPQPYTDVVSTLPVKSEEEGNITFDISFENFL